MVVYLMALGMVVGFVGALAAVLYLGLGGVLLVAILALIAFAAFTDR